MAQTNTSNGYFDDPIDTSQNGVTGEKYDDLKAGDPPSGSDRDSMGYPRGQYETGVVEDPYGGKKIGMVRVCINESRQNA